MINSYYFDFYEACRFGSCLNRKQLFQPHFESHFELRSFRNNPSDFQQAHSLVLSELAHVKYLYKSLMRLLCACERAVMMTFRRVNAPRRPKFISLTRVQTPMTHVGIARPCARLIDVLKRSRATRRRDILRRRLSRPEIRNGSRKLMAGV